MRLNLPSTFKAIALAVTAFTSQQIFSQTTVFINEIHYDNIGGDVNEGAEVAGPAGTDLTGWTIAYYNGSTNEDYVTTMLSGTIPNLGGGFGAVFFPESSIQNGAPDGLALVDDMGVVVQFLTYEGIITATGGPAMGLTSVDIGVAESNSTTAATESLQLTGTGSEFEDFTWAAAATATNNAFNNAQTFSGGSTITTVEFTAVSNTVDETSGSYDLTLSIVDEDAVNATTVEVALLGGTLSRVGNYTTQTVTFPAGDGSDQTVTVTVTDNGACDGNETFVFLLQNVTGGSSAQIGMNDLFSSELIDDETVALASFTQDFEPGDNWAIVAGAGNISAADGAGDTPANERILGGTNSWQVNNGTATLELATQTVPGAGATITARVSSTAGTSGNGNDGGDFVEFYVDIDGTGFPFTPDITINGNNNARWGFSNGNSIASTTAGVPATFAPAAGGNTTDGFSFVVIDIPPSATTVALQIIAENNSASEIWSIEQVELTSPTCFPTYFSQASGTEVDPIWSTSADGSSGLIIPVWDQFASAHVQAGHVITQALPTALAINNLEIDATGEMTLALMDRFASGSAAAETTVNGVLNVTGTLALNGDHTIRSAVGDILIAEVTNGGNWMLESDVSVSGNIQVTPGATIDVAPTSLLILTSDALSTGRLGTLSGGSTFTGELMMERFIPAGVTSWRTMGSAVQGQTLAEWNDDFFTTSFPGADAPLVGGTVFPSIRSYDETNTGSLLLDGLIAPSDVSDMIAPGQGYAAWAGDSLQGTNAFIIDVTGVPNTGAVTLPMTYTSSGMPLVDGWNLVANPMPSPVDFSLVNLGVEVDNNYFVFDPVSGNNAAWNEALGISIPAGALNGNIQSSQAFWLHATGPNFTTTIDESAKVDEAVAGGLFGGSQVQNVDMARLQISSGLNTYYDEVALVFGANGNDTFESNDMMKFIFNNGSSPQIAAESSDGITTALNYWGTLTSDVSIPVQVQVPTTGTYTLTLFDAASILGASCLVLEDLTTGQLITLSEGTTYDFMINANAPASPARFMLHASAAAAYEQVDVVCAGDATGSASVTNPTAVNWTVEWMDASGTVFQTQNVAAGTTTVNNLSAGNYSVAIAGGCGNLVRAFTINEPNGMGASSAITAATCATSSDASLILSPQGGVAPLSYDWSNGSSNKDLLNVSAGTYDLIITDATGCQFTGTYQVTAGTGPIAVATASSTSVLVGEEIEFYGLHTTGSLLQWNMGDGTFYNVDEPFHTYNTPGTYNVEFAVDLNGCETIAFVDIDVATSTDIVEIEELDFTAFLNQEQIFLSWNKAGLQGKVLDLTGRVVRDNVNMSGSAGNTTISMQGESAGVYFLIVQDGDSSSTLRLPLVR